MKIFMTHIVGLALILSLLACAKQPVMIDRIFIENATNGKITDVEVRHEPTKKFGAVNAILPEEALEIGLSSAGKHLLAERAIVQWMDVTGQQWNVTLNIPYDQFVAKANQPVRLVYTIHPSGRATVHLE